MSSYQKFYNEPFDIDSLKVFGCLCYTSTLTSNIKKLDPQAMPCIFLGHKPHKKGYVTFNLHTRGIEISRHVIFYENCFPYSAPSISDSTQPFSLAHPSIVTHDYPIMPSSSAPVVYISNDSLSSYSPIHESSSTSSYLVPFDPPLQRSKRQILGPQKFHDFHIKYTSVATTHQPSIRYPSSLVLSYDKLSPSYHSFILSITT